MFSHPQPQQARPSAAPAGTSPARSPIPPCASSSPRPTASAASGSSARTTGTRRSAPRTSTSSAPGSARSRPPASSTATESSTPSTRSSSAPASRSPIRRSAIGSPDQTGHTLADNLGGEPQGSPRGRGRRLPELLHAARAEYRPRTQFRAVHGRGADQLRDEGAHPPPQPMATRRSRRARRPRRGGWPRSTRARAEASGPRAAASAGIWTRRAATRRCGPARSGPISAGSSGSSRTTTNVERPHAAPAREPVAA